MHNGLYKVSVLEGDSSTLRHFVWACLPTGRLSAGLLRVTSDCIIHFVLTLNLYWQGFQIRAIWLNSSVSDPVILSPSC